MTITIKKNIPAKVGGKVPSKSADDCQGKTDPEVIEPDRLSELASTVENIPNQDAAHARATDLMLDHALNYFELGGVLAMINKNKWFGAHASFQDYCVNEHGFRQGKAYYVMAIHKGLVENKVPWSVVEKAGWSKTGLICSKYAAGVVDEEKFFELLNDAATTPYKQLAAELKGKTTADGAATTKVLTFKPHPDQVECIELALEKAKDASGTKHDTVALEYICGGYIAGPMAKPFHVKPDDDEPSTDADVTPVSPDVAFVDRFRALGIAETLNRVAEDDREGMVVAFLMETGADELSRLLDLAFPDDPNSETDEGAA